MFPGGKQFESIITVGICPCWDVTCYVAGAEWGEHVLLSGQSIEPAGKALNVSKALAWMGASSTAAGLWGKGDYQQFLEEMKPLQEFVQEKMTAVDGKTRRNITVVDTVGGREMHLRAKSELASREGLERLRRDLKGIVKKGSICVFSGAMPSGELLEDCLGVLDACRSAGAHVVFDGSGEALKWVIETGGLWIIKPNLAELCELLGKSVSDEPGAIAQEAGVLLEKVDIVLVSRGRKGAVAVSRQGTVKGVVKNEAAVSGTVGCGDYLLAGFLDGLTATDDISSALEKALKAASAKAFGWTQKLSWDQVRDNIKVSISTLR